MASHLRTAGARAQKRGRGGGGGGGGGASDECPVCITAFKDCEGGTEGARVTFPCGHAVCGACDDRMRRRGFHSCPMCRTPREGFSEGQVALAAQARTLADAAVDGDDEDAQWVHAGWTVHHVGGNQAAFEEFIRSHAVAGELRPRARAAGWHVMFFPDESTGDPFDVLRAVIRPPVGGGPRPARISSRRTRHSSRDRRRSTSDDEEHPAAEADDGAAALQPRGGTSVMALLDPSLQDLINNHLLQPTDLNTFLARHRDVTRSSRA